jgi:release factor glutamine methyltransferase
MTIRRALRLAAERLHTSPTPLLDAEILLQIVLQKPRVYFLTHGEDTLSPEEALHFQALVEKRAQGCPIAYLRGSQEFWSLDLKITPAVLIPRPETEYVVEAALQSIHDTHAHIADIGTGSGCIAIALAHERPTWNIIATDIESAALQLAQENAAHHQCQNISFFLRAGLSHFSPESLDAIISNPPYIAADDPALETHVAQYEPHSALIAEEQGFALLFQIAIDARTILKPGGLLILEHGRGQEGLLTQRLQQLGYQDMRSIADLQHINRVLLARLPAPLNS